MPPCLFFAFRQPQKGGFARTVKDKGGRSVHCFASYARKILLHRIPAIYVRMKAHTAGIFQNNIFLSLTAQARIRKKLLPKGKSKFDHAKSRIICTTYYLQKGSDML